MGVGYGEVNCIAVVVGGRTVVYDLCCGRGIEKFCSFGKIGFRDQFLRWDFGNIGIGHPPGGIGEGYFESFDACMEMTSAC